MLQTTFRYVFVILWLSFQMLPSYGQRNNRKKDSVMTAVQELRRQIKFSADIRDYADIASIRQQLNTAFDTTKYVTLLDEEEIVINYMIRDYNDILKQVAAWPQTSDDNYYLEYPQEDGLLDHLLDIAVLDSVQLSTQVDQSQRQPYEKAFLQLYLQAFLSLNPASDIPETTVTRMGQTYLDQHAPSPFDRFVKLRIRRKYVKNNWGATVGLGVARGTFQGEFGNLLRFNVPVLLDLEVNYQKMIAGLRLSVGEGTVRRDFEYDGFWDRGLKVNPFYGGLYVGYMLEVAPFRIIPYYDVGGTVITVAEQDMTVDNEEQDIGTFTHGPGLSLDFMSPFSWSGFDNEVYRLGLRFKGGMLFNNFKNKGPMFESRYPYLGIALILDFVGTELDTK